MRPGRPPKEPSFSWEGLLQLAGTTLLAGTLLLRVLRTLESLESVRRFYSGAGGPVWTPLFLALFLYRFHLAEKTVSIAIILIYIAASLFAGFISGKKIGNRKFLWGLLAGVLYFTVLLCVSLALDHGAAGISGNLVTVFFICAGGGMLGGMLG